MTGEPTTVLDEEMLERSLGATSWSSSYKDSSLAG
jgi:hypothetical protein